MRTHKKFLIIKLVTIIFLLCLYTQIFSMLGNIPEDIVAHEILPFLEKKDLLNTRITNKKFKVLSDKTIFVDTITLLVKTKDMKRKNKRSKLSYFLSRIFSINSAILITITYPERNTDFKIHNKEEISNTIKNIKQALPLGPIDQAIYDTTYNANLMPKTGWKGIRSLRANPIMLGKVAIKAILNQLSSR